MKCGQKLGERTIKQPQNVTNALIPEIPSILVLLSYIYKNSPEDDRLGRIH